MGSSMARSSTQKEEEGVKGETLLRLLGEADFGLEKMEKTSFSSIMGAITLDAIIFYRKKISF